jgi:hypothetical protein
MQSRLLAELEIHQVSDHLHFSKAHHSGCFNFAFLTLAQAFYDDSGRVQTQFLLVKVNTSGMLYTPCLFKYDFGKPTVYRILKYDFSEEKIFCKAALLRFKALVRFRSAANH